MKIKLIRDIPGYKAGKELEGIEVSNYEVGSGCRFVYKLKDLISEGWAEEVKEIDVEVIRSYYKNTEIHGRQIDFQLDFASLTISEQNWFKAFLVVKAVIEQLNGDWKADWKDGDENKYIIYSDRGMKLEIERNQIYIFSLLPYCKNKETAQKVIDLCTPELEMLFGLNKN